MAPTESSLFPSTSRSPDESRKSQATTDSPTDGTGPLATALRALELRHPEETVALARRRLQADPADAVTYAVLGVALCQTGQIASALQALERAHYLNPHDARILYNYGLVLEAAGRPAAAKIRYYAALRLAPRYARARERLVQPLPTVSSLPAKDAPPSPASSSGLPLERLRVDDFQSDWTDGVLPKPPLSSWRSPELVREPPPPASVVTFSDEELPPQPTRPVFSVEGEQSTPSPPAPNRVASERRRVAGSIVLVQVLAFSLLIGAIALKLFWPASPAPNQTTPVMPPSEQKPMSQSGDSREKAVQAKSSAAGPSYRGAQLVGTDLRDRSLANADFEEADLSRAILVRADLQAATLAYASLPGADLRNANLVKANLLGTLLRDTDLRGADLRSAYLKSARLSNANLSTAWLEEATLTHADLRQAILQRAQLPKARLQNANLSHADLREANLQGADLQDTDLTGANLRGAKLDDANLNGARYDRDTRWPIGMLPAERGAKRVLSTP